MPATERSAFWRWRHARPFWGGLFVLLGGGWILLTMKAPLPVVLHVGMTGLAGYLVPILLVLCGILLIVSPGQRLFYSLLAAVLALGSWITSNLGGFVIGLLLALVGSALAFAWSPDKRRRPAALSPAESMPSPAESMPPPAESMPPPAESMPSPAGKASLLAQDASPPSAEMSPPTAEMSPTGEMSPPSGEMSRSTEDISPPADDVESTQEIATGAPGSRPETSRGRPRHRRP